MVYTKCILIQNCRPFFDGMRPFWVGVSLCRFFFNHVYTCIAVGDPVIQRGVIRFNTFTFFYACSKPGPEFQTSIGCGFFVCAVSEGDCSLCCYWWYCWSLLFKLSLHKQTTNNFFIRRRSFLGYIIPNV